MHKIFTRTAAVAAAVAIGTGALALSAPDAGAASRGTATATESRKVMRQAEDQRCLTLREARKYVKGTGTYSGTDDIGARYYHWSGKGSVRSLDISVLQGCTDLVVVDWRRNATTYWGNYGAWQAYAA
jgi:hypothetical protein